MSAGGSERLVLSPHFHTHTQAHTHTSTHTSTHTHTPSLHSAHEARSISIDGGAVPDAAIDFSDIIAGVFMPLPPLWTYVPGSAAPFHNRETGTSHAMDPRPLPRMWEQRVAEDGRVYFLVGVREAKRCVIRSSRSPPDRTTPPSRRTGATLAASSWSSPSSPVDVLFATPLLLHRLMHTHTTPRRVEARTAVNGREYFLDHLTKMTSWIHPRVLPEYAQGVQRGSECKRIPCFFQTPTRYAGSKMLLQRLLGCRTAGRWCTLTMEGFTSGLGYYLRPHTPRAHSRTITHPVPQDHNTKQTHWNAPGNQDVHV